MGWIFNKSKIRQSHFGDNLIPNCTVEKVHQYSGIGTGDIIDLKVKVCPIQPFSPRGIWCVFSGRSCKNFACTYGKGHFHLGHRPSDV